MAVGSPGSVITRGYGSGRIVVRGYTGAEIVVIPELVLPSVGRSGASRRAHEKKPAECYTIVASLVRVNDHEIVNPKVWTQRVCYDGSLVTARIVDVDVEYRSDDDVIVTATFVSAITGQETTVSASLPVATAGDDSLFVKASPKAVRKGASDIFIAVGKITRKKTDE